MAARGAGVRRSVSGPTHGQILKQANSYPRPAPLDFIFNGFEPPEKLIIGLYNFNIFDNKIYKETFRLSANVPDIKLGDPQ